MSRQCILVVEDDDAIREGIVDALQFQGYATLEAADGATAAEMTASCEYELLLLDLVLPGGDGLDILRDIRVVRPTQPVIILTARGREKDRVRGLRLGADDYVVKPFSVDELLARVEAVLRRSPERPSDVSVIGFPGGRADLARCEVRYDNGDKAKLSERERELLRYLACNAGRAISREEILARVWRLDPTGIETRTIDVHIARLREKFRDTTSPPSLILTVHGKGYMFVKDQQQTTSDGQPPRGSPE
jgi:DNA-binding response OmpR family regulator